jgi:cytochrome c biogenesis protein ResB
LCKLTLTKKTASGKPAVFTKEQWLTEGTHVNDSIRGEVNGEPFQEPIRLGFQNKQISLGFELELTRAESLVDPGTNSPATYSSFVKLTDEQAGVKGEDHWITMNEPLDYRGYKVYQSSFVTDDETDNGKAVHLSGFTIGRDPGLWFKYIGTAMIGLGIVTMFWMKAYINNPKVGWLFQFFSLSRLFSLAR